jgi:hypothetical protein
MSVGEDSTLLGREAVSGDKYLAMFGKSNFNAPVLIVVY